MNCKIMGNQGYKSMHNGDGKCYLMNSSKSEIWQIGHELMEYVM